VHDAFRQAIALQAGHLQSAGQQFGIRYRSDAVLPDGVEVAESTISEYRESGSPGARAPHIWLQTADGRALSTIDVFGRSFVLLAAGDGLAWIQAVRMSAQALAVGLVAHQLGPEGPLVEVGRRFTRVYGVSDSGAVIVRPDGYVLARFLAAVTDPVDALDTALERLLTGQRPDAGAAELSAAIGGPSDG
jgi:hypothetical protein